MRNRRQSKRWAGRQIALALALMLALPGACIADEESQEEPFAVEASAPENAAEPAPEAPPVIEQIFEDDAPPLADGESLENLESAGDADDAGEEDDWTGEADDAVASFDEEGLDGGDSPQDESEGDTSSTGGDPSEGDAGDSQSSEDGTDPGGEGGGSGAGDGGDSGEGGAGGDSDPGDPFALTISVEGATRTEDGAAWRIPYAAPEDEIRFTWTAIAGAAEYAWSISEDASGSEIASGTQAGTALVQRAQDYLSGRFTLTVSTWISASLPGEELQFGEEATPGEGDPLLTARYTFELQRAEESGQAPGGEDEEQSGDRPSGESGNRPSGGFGGGSRTSASGGSASAAGQGDPGLQITPGEALTADHASGSKDMTAYGTVRLRIAKSTQTRLTLGGTKLDISLADGGSFQAELSGDSLILSAQDGAEWSVNGLALEVLERSGVGELMLYCGESSVRLPTGLRFSGPVYAACRARGCVAKDFELRASASGVSVIADGERCALGDDGTLVRE